MKIDSIIILTYNQDYWLARICLASVRYHYPEIPIYLLKNIGPGDFDTSDAERYWQANIFPATGDWGRSIGRLEPLFDKSVGRFFLIDADEVMVGSLVDYLEQFDEDLVVAPEYLRDIDHSFDNNYFNRMRLRDLAPDFVIPEFVFNAGQYLATGGVLRREDFDEVVEWTFPRRIKDNQTFRCAEQGLFNYVVRKVADTGRITVRPEPYMDLARTEYFFSVDIESIKKRTAQPRLFHWAGENKTFFPLMRRGDILKFFDDYFYSRIPDGDRIQAENHRKLRNAKLQGLRAWAKRRVRKHARPLIKLARRLK